MTNPADTLNKQSEIPALVPGDDDGHQFVCYADCCSGIAGTAHEQTFAQVNGVLCRLNPQPEFICFPGDEIRGLTLDEDALREQWRYWLGTEMAWINTNPIPLYNTTGNHTAYDTVSRKVFREMLHHLPQNGPTDQRGLSYYVRRDNALLVFVNTLNDTLGGEGYVETEWLDHVLAQHQGLKHKLVFGHHPVFPVNGFSGLYQRQLGTECGAAFWAVLLKHGVTAYFCSHMLAFDVQVHQGILQILTAGAGTAPLMPDEREYHHLVQASVDDAGLRYQTLDKHGQIREWLDWPPNPPPFASWTHVLPGGQLAPSQSAGKLPSLFTWHFTGRCRQDSSGHAQTLLSCWDKGTSPPLIWIGFRGKNPRVAVLLRHTPGRSPHLWLGPMLTPGKRFDLQIALHPRMGPGGVLWRSKEETRWTSMEAASPWGPERLSWPAYWSVGYERDNPLSQPFKGENLRVSWTGSLLEKPFS